MHASQGSPWSQGHKPRSMQSVQTRDSLEYEIPWVKGSGKERLVFI